jgi:hypothetical protein
MIGLHWQHCEDAPDLEGKKIIYIHIGLPVLTDYKC